MNIFTDTSRYIVNFGDGSQRLAVQHKLKLSRVNSIFLTDVSWTSFGGITGASMTIAEHKNELSICGPSGLGAQILSSKAFFFKYVISFIFQRNFPISSY